MAISGSAKLAIGGLAAIIAFVALIHDAPTGPMAPISSRKVDARTLAREWSENNVEASTRYGGRALIVSGKVRRVSDAGDAGAAIFFLTDRLPLVAYIENKDMPAAAKLRPDDGIVIACNKLTDVIDGQLALANCHLQPETDGSKTRG